MLIVIYRVRSGIRTMFKKIQTVKEMSEKNSMNQVPTCNKVGTLFESLLNTPMKQFENDRGILKN